MPSLRSQTNYAPLLTQSHIIAMLLSNEESFTLYDGFGKAALLRSFEPRNPSGKISLMGLLSHLKKRYFIRLWGTKEGQECASKGHIEIFSMSSGERQRKSRRTLKEQERYKRYSKGRVGAHKRNNRGTEDVQQRYKRWTTEVQQGPYTKLRIHNTGVTYL